MIPQPYRMKGNALVLGASRAGEVGPFGPYGAGSVDNEQDQDHSSDMKDPTPGD
ncbi:hypothetical protein ACH4FA_01935 [Streptomyces sp. NPDC017966]|uniref:hypothetical protein n=1 Tax=unclassified Streptomyces TaxID=2593676 RepID=UPI001C1E099A|nr:hypothetical protein [Streptomyces sp. PAM3C]MBU5946431.1 hypothetical protein [Streptomyces sp. PAM3C]